MIGSALQIFWVDIPDEPGYRVVQFDRPCLYRWYGAAGRRRGRCSARLSAGVLFTDIGAKIIICLLIFVFLMLVTGTTILTLVPYGLEAGGKNQGIH